MPVIRAFIAVELSPAIQDQLRKVILQLSPATRAVRWVPPENIHLTMKFLGDVEGSKIPLLQDNLQDETSRCQPFEIRVGGLGAFPNQRRPRVVWIGVQAPAALSALVQAVEAATVPLGFPTEERSFSPHLTLGRVSQHASPDEAAALGALLARTVVGELGKTKIHSVTLYRSDLRPTGSVYSAISQAKLAIAA
jgi:2'-5' RNA ligase